jgi:hypothetical protein
MPPRLNAEAHPAGPGRDGDIGPAGRFTPVRQGTVMVIRYPLFQINLCVKGTRV